MRQTFDNAPTISQWENITRFINNRGNQLLTQKTVSYTDRLIIDYRYPELPQKDDWRYLKAYKVDKGRITTQEEEPRLGNPQENNWPRISLMLLAQPRQLVIMREEETKEWKFLYSVEEENFYDSTMEE